MAAALVGEAFLSASIQVLIDRITTKKRKLDESLTKKLKITLLSLHAALNDAEEKQVFDAAVREWLCEVKDAVFDADDLLDEIDSEALRYSLESEDRAVNLAKVWNFISNSPNQFHQGMIDIITRLEVLAKQKDMLGLREGVWGKGLPRTPTTSLVDESVVCGRDGDKENMAALLLSDGDGDDASSNGVSVISIVGMAGVGKTTLAQLLYNDERMEEHFDVKAWVWVSEDFDVLRITKTLLESVTSKSFHSSDLNSLQVELNEQVRGKKFLFVLDDVWDENDRNWDVLRAPFAIGARGSKVIVTTRSRNVASIVQTVGTAHYLEQLSHEDCWLLLAKHAFGNASSSAHPNLEEIGKKISRKCNGLPLAAETLGGLLRCSQDSEEWSSILNSNIWDPRYDNSNLLPALRLSYDYLPPHLKRCFAYCSIFPKGYEFQKKKLVLLWVAEGLIPEDELTMEEVGQNFFDELILRSLFQRSRIKESSFTMHDLISDLAVFVSGEFCFRWEGRESHEVPARVRHLSYIKERIDSTPKFEPLYGMKHLRTFLPTSLAPYEPFFGQKFYLSEWVLQDFLPSLRGLRVLSLSQYCNITELPDSIGNLSRLRYMDLSYTAIRRLPDVVCTLYNLQTVLLSGCSFLTELPANMSKLLNLRHLDISQTSIEKMPLHMSRLKSLRTLTTFVVGKSSGSSIRELRELSHLQGKLSILKLQNVADATDALLANLTDKKELKELELVWDDEDTNDSPNEGDVLCKLEPPINLEKLTIKFYGGTSFPNWLGCSSFSNMQFLWLNDCRYCLSLPPLGQLPSLKELYIKRMNSIKTIGLEFYGSESSIIPPFRSLSMLEFEEMPEWEEWLPSGGQCSDFPSLQELILHECSKLRGNLPSHLLSLKKLSVSDCGVLQKGACNTLDMESQSSLEELKIDGCPVLLPEKKNPSMFFLHELSVRNVVDIECLPRQVVQNRNCLKKLSLWNCPSLLSFPGDGLPSSLMSLHVQKCRRLEFMPHEMMAKLKSLEVLHLSSSCDSLRSFPLGIFPKLSYLSISNCVNLESIYIEEVDENLSHLYCLYINGCPNLVKGCCILKPSAERIHALTALRRLVIFNLPNLVSFAEEGFPPNLQEFQVGGCDKLKPSVGWGLQGLVSLREFEIWGSDDLLETLLKEQLLPSSLDTLFIYGLSSLESLDEKGLQKLSSLQKLEICKCSSLEFLPEEGLKHLTSLKELHITGCNGLKFLPKEGLPTSLSFLSITKCSALVIDRTKIAHIPCIEIDEEVII